MIDRNFLEQIKAANRSPLNQAALPHLKGPPAQDRLLVLQLAGEGLEAGAADSLALFPPVDQDYLGELVDRLAVAPPDQVEDLLEGVVDVEALSQAKQPRQAAMRLLEALVNWQMEVLPADPD